MPPLSRVNIFLLDDDDDYLGSGAAGLQLSTWLNFVSYMAGRLHVSARRLMFDPDDHAHPVHVFALAAIRDVTFTEHSAAKQNGSLKAVRFTCSSYLTGAAKDGVGEMTKPPSPQTVWTFRLGTPADAAFEDSLRTALMHLGVESLLRRQELRLLQCGPQGSSGQGSPAPSIAESVASFPVERVVPLRRQRGVVHMSSDAISFEALFPFTQDSACSRVRIAASAIAHVFPRSIGFHSTGIDVYTGKPKSVLGELVLSLQFSSTQEREHALKFLEMTTSIPTFRMSFAQVTEAWQQHRLSNYHYLYLLNKVASRCTADLSQYPVFPWVLRDYTSANIDLKDISVYRDLSRPIGALNVRRLQELKARQEALEAVDEGAGQRAGGHHLYSTHYSSAGAVSYYLVRSHPEYQLCLQHGRFDHAQRIFESIAATWESVLCGTSDYKELVPEFYEPSEGMTFLLAQPFTLGAKDDGTEVSRAVVLPPWAAGSAERFGQVHAAALESDHVSSRLHHWIDLVFGYKQTGEAAAAADNTFHPFTYPPPPASVAGLGAMPQTARPTNAGWPPGVGGTDVRAAYAREFGCTPTKLFSCPHPARVPGGTANGEVAEQLLAALTPAAWSLSSDACADVRAEQAHTAAQAVPTRRPSSSSRDAHETATAGARVEHSHTPLAPPAEASASAVEAADDKAAPPVSTPSCSLLQGPPLSCRALASFPAVSAGTALDLAQCATPRGSAYTLRLVAISALSTSDRRGEEEMSASEDADDDEEEILLTAVCDGQRQTVCVFDCESGKKLRAFTDFDSTVAHMTAYGDCVLLFMSNRDMYLIGVRTRAVVEHFTDFTAGFVTVSVVSRCRLAVSDSEGQVLAWDFTDNSGSSSVCSVLQDRAPQVDFESPSPATCLAAEKRGGLLLLTTRDGEAWVGGAPPHTWSSFPLAGGSPAASGDNAVCGLSFISAESDVPTAVVVRASAVQLYDVSSGALLFQRPFSSSDWRCETALSLDSQYPLPLVCVGAGGRCAVLLGGTAGEVVERTWSLPCSAPLLLTGGCGLLAVLDHAGTVTLCVPADSHT